MGAYKKGNRWYADFYIDGKRKREVVKLEGVPPHLVTRQDAQKFLHIKMAEIAQGVYVAKKEKPVLFDKLVTAFIEGYSKTNKRSWSRDVTNCKMLMSHFGGKKISQITPWLVDKYKSKRLKHISRRGKPISKATVNRELACLKKMLSYAVGEKWLTANPLRGYKLFKERPNRVRVISREEFQRVYIEAAKHMKSILVTAYNTGMRRSEILNLKWEDVDLREGLILVPDSKNGEPRYVPINDELMEVLRALKEKAKDTGGAGYVFNYEGKRIGSFKTAFDAAVRRAGVDRFTFHDLRHTYASNLVMEGVDIATVQELLGHKSIVMTKRYSHPTLQHKKQAVGKIKSGVMDTYLDTTVIELPKQGDVSN